MTAIVHTQKNKKQTKTKKDKKCRMMKERKKKGDIRRKKKWSEREVSEIMSSLDLRKGR